MNIDIARRRYMDVIRPDVMHNSQGDFLATHVPMKRLYVTEQLTDHAEVPEQDKKHPKTEEDVYEQFMGEKEEDQFVLVIGDSGAGKSHLIRWINSVLEIRKSEDEIVLPIRRADNTLKGTIRQLIELPEVRDLPNRELYKKLASAAAAVSEKELKETIYYQFIIQVTNDDGKAGDEEGERKVNNVDRKHLIALLQNSLFKTRLMDDDGPIDRIYGKFAENRTNEINDKAPEFVREDFEIDAEFRNQLYLGADDKARKIADKLLGKPDFVDSVKEYMNLFVDKVIQRCAGLEPGDLASVIEEIRRELLKQGKTLTILIEDITAASGVDDSLLDALLTDKIEYPDKNMCRLNAVVGSTGGYYREKFRSNTKGRIHNFVYVPDDLFSGNQSGLIEFFAKYLNTISLSTEDISKWVQDGKADLNNYPIHTDTIGKGWGEYKYNGQAINLFPFTKNAIVFLYEKQETNKRNPRALMREIIEPYIKDAMEHLDEFPLRRPSFQASNTELQNSIYNNNTLDDATKIRLSFFMYIWGDGTLRLSERNGEKIVAGIPSSVYRQLGLPIIDGVQVSDDSGLQESQQDNSKVGGWDGKGPTVEETPEKENEQVLIALAEADRWIEQKDYKLNIGATTKNVRALNDVRKNINGYLFDTIDWLSEGVSIDAMVKVKDTNKFLVAFERQTMKSDAVITLPASIESRKIIEAFVRWSEVGKKSWNFKGSTDYLYRVQRWSESIKPFIVKAVISYDDKKTDYFTYAAAAEYYRLIFNGYCKNYQSPQNFTAEMLLAKNPANTEEN
ncbi:MAG: ATP-binding protein, partial [Clostridium sp.]|nr:ATP-binding protein [Clostridium sp.]